MAVDAGYIVLPPLAAAIYKALGRSPLVGLAAVFAGVAAGFNANLLVTGLDPLLAGLTEEAARILDPGYNVNPACNWYFMIASTFLITFVGWGVSAYIVEPRLRTKSPEEGGPGGEGEAMDLDLTSDEKKGLVWASIATIVTLGALFANVLIPGGFLYDKPGSIGTGPEQQPFATWIGAIVPLLVLLFFFPGLAYGLAVGVDPLRPRTSSA